MHDNLIEHMRERVAKCRRLARATTDKRTALILRVMADEGEADIRSASLRSGNWAAGSRSPKGKSSRANKNLRGGPQQLRNIQIATSAAGVSANHVKSWLSARRARETLFGSLIFSDPAWDIILELYAAKLEDRRIVASELLRTSNAPRSVIHRWLKVLVEAGLVSVDPDLDMDTRATIDLADEAAAKMAQLIDRWGFFLI